MEERVAIQIQHDKNCYEMLRIAAKSGYKYVALGFGSSKCFHEINWEEEIDTLRVLLQENNLQCIMTHAPYYDLRISAEILDVAMETALLRCVKATSLLGAEIMAVHPRTCDDYNKSFECNVKNIAPLLEEAERCGCLIGIENLPLFPGWEKKFFTYLPEEHTKLVDAFGSSNVCAVWDFGHANLSNADPAHAISILGNRIKGTHVHDNNHRRDDHLPPFWVTTSWGPSVKWESVIKELKHTDFSGFLTLEIEYNFDMGIRSYVKNSYDIVTELYEILRREE